MLESNQKSEVRGKLLKYAVNILSRRPYFRHTLREKLLLYAKRYNIDKNRHCEEQSDVAIQDHHPFVDNILDNLSKSGYLDDQYLAEAFVRRQFSKFYGPKIIFLKLRQLRLDSSIIDLVLSTEEVKELESDAINKFITKNRSLDRRKIVYKLYSRGFTSASINKTFDVVGFED